MELQSALVVENPIPLDATVWNQSLVYVFRRGWEQAEPNPVQRQVSHTWFFQKPWGEQRHGWQPETWVATGSPTEGTQGGPKASYTLSGQRVSSSSPTPFWGARAVPLPFTPPWQ